MLTWLIVWLVSENIVSNELNIYLMVIFHTTLYGCVCAAHTGIKAKPKNNVISTNWFTSIKMQSQNKPKCAKELLDTIVHFLHVRNYSFMQILVFFSLRIDRHRVSVSLCCVPIKLAWPKWVCACACSFSYIELNVCTVRLTLYLMVVHQLPLHEYNNNDNHAFMKCVWVQFFLIESQIWAIYLNSFDILHV